MVTNKIHGYKGLWRGAAGGYKNNHHWDKILMRTRGFFVMAIKAINKNNMFSNWRAHYIQGKLNITNIFLLNWFQVCWCWSLATIFPSFSEIRPPMYGTKGRPTKYSYHESWPKNEFFYIDYTGFKCVCKSSFLSPPNSKLITDANSVWDGSFKNIHTRLSINF